MAFPTSKIELHQWANTILLGVVGFFVVQTYTTIQKDHEKLAEHETRITVTERNMEHTEKAVNFLTGKVEQSSNLRRRGLQ